MRHGIPIDFDNVSVRDLEESEIPLVLKYWYHSPPGFIESLGVDPKKMPTEDAMKQSLHEKISINSRFSQSKLNVLVIDYGGEPVGFHTINPVVEGDYGIFHAHIWNPQVRGKGIATTSYPLACREFIHRFGLKKIVFKTPIQNHAAIKVKEKLGLNRIGDETIGFGIIKDGTPAHVYELSATELEDFFEQ